jgi:Tol biopolymer transport system component
VALVTYQENVTRQVWVYDPERDSMAQVRFERGLSNSPTWTPDGRSLAFVGRLPEQQIFLIPADGSNAAEPLTEPSLYTVYPDAWTPDGRTLVYEKSTPTMGYDLWTLSLDDRQGSPWLASRFNEGGAELSPDGRFIAYRSDESGQYEIYVQPFPGPGAKWKISTNGGTEPCWARSGRELFYREGDKMMAVGIETSPEVSFSKPLLLFSGRYETSFQIYGYRFYDVFPDGEHFVMIRSDESANSTELALVQNWGREVERLAPSR